MNSYQSPLTISSVMQDIYENKYVLPSLQREFVWKSEQIENLFDSLMRGYPIGTFLFWKINAQNAERYKFYKFLKEYSQLDKTHNERIDIKGISGLSAVLDGQQRLTALYLGLKGTYAYKLKHKREKDGRSYPERKLYLNLLSNISPKNSESEYSENSDELYEFKFLTDGDVKYDWLKNKYWFEVGKILDVKNAGEINRLIRRNPELPKESVYSEDQLEFAVEVCTQLYIVVKVTGTISYFEETAEDLDKVLNIFVRLNKAGTELDYSDLLLSMAIAQWEEIDARKEIIEFVDDINRTYNLKTDKDFVLKSALVLCDFNNIAFKAINFTKNNTLEIEKHWEDIKRAIRLTAELISSLGYSGESLSSNHALIPIAYYLYTIGMPDRYSESKKYKTDREKIKKWLIRSLLSNVFSGQSDNILKKVRDIIKKNDTGGFPLEKIIETFKGTDKSIQFTEDDIDSLLTRTYNYDKKDVLSTLMLLYPSFEFSKNKFTMDHIYPKKKFKEKTLIKEGISKSKHDVYLSTYNEIVNLQLLTSHENSEKQGRDFDEWFNTHNPSEKDKDDYRKTHYLPIMDYTLKNYPKFIKERRKLLKTYLKEVLGVI